MSVRLEKLELQYKLMESQMDLIIHKGDLHIKNCERCIRYSPAHCNILGKYQKSLDATKQELTSIFRQISWRRALIDTIHRINF